MDNIYVGIKECGGGSNKSVRIKIDTRDFGILVGDRFYRFEMRGDDIVFPLINGCDCKITTMNGYPAVKLKGEKR